VTPLAAALRLLDDGRSVVPCTGKAPLVPWRTFQARLPTFDEVEGWFREWPDASLGLVTGTISNVAVLDVDRPDGASFDRAFGAVAELAPGLVAPTAATPRDGRHLFFAAPADRLGCNTRVRGYALDVKAEGGLVCLPPAPGRRWLVDLADEAPPPLPGALLDFLRRPMCSANGDSSLDIVTRGTDRGTRNAGLARLAWLLLCRRVDAEVVRAELLATNQRLRPPLAESEVLKLWGNTVRNHGARRSSNSSNGSNGSNSNAPIPQQQQIPLIPDPHSGSVGGIGGANLPGRSGPRRKSMHDSNGTNGTNGLPAWAGAGTRVGRPDFSEWWDPAAGDLDAVLVWQGEMAGKGGRGHFHCFVVETGGKLVGLRERAGLRDLRRAVVGKRIFVRSLGKQELSGGRSMWKFLVHAEQTLPEVPPADEGEGEPGTDRVPF
jgi:bifunctional DNA primase/polymerase-like protein/primase-like protein